MFSCCFMGGRNKERQMLQKSQQEQRCFPAPGIEFGGVVQGGVCFMY